MAQPRVCVLRAPGTNCDIETEYAFRTAGGDPERVHLFRLLEEPDLLRSYQALCIPGGFSYGDDVGAGVVFGSQLRSHLGAAIGEFLQRDTLVLGICNGFQVLMKSGILPGGSSTWGGDDGKPRDATLTWNENGKYTALWVHLDVRSHRSPFLKGLERLELPIAHAEGRLVPRDSSVLENWHKSGQVALCYADPRHAAMGASSDVALLPYPINPNGSTDNIAGLCDPTGRVLGLMPHPERHLFATQHPQWTRLGLKGEGAGMAIFRNAVEYFRA